MNEQRQTAERYAAKLAEHSDQHAESACRSAYSQMKAAVEKSCHLQLASMLEVKKTRDAAVKQVNEVQQELQQQRLWCEQTVEMERVCAAQAKSIANALCEGEEQLRSEELGRRKEQLKFAQQQAAKS